MELPGWRMRWAKIPSVHTLWPHYLGASPRRNAEDTQLCLKERTECEVRVAPGPALLRRCWVTPCSPKPALCPPPHSPIPLRDTACPLGSPFRGAHSFFQSQHQQFMFR